MLSGSDVEIVARGCARLLWQEGPPPKLTEAQHQTVNEIWDRGVAELGDALYDGALLVYRGHETAGNLTTIHGTYQPYRHYYAQNHGLDCGMNPIGVSGLIVFTEGVSRTIVIGRRSENVAYYRGHWECVPSGGVNDSCARADGTVDFAAMLQSEFEEETCLPVDKVRQVTPFAVIYDRVACTYDICCELDVATTRDELVAAMRQSEEYTEVLVVTEDELNDCARKLGDELLPLSRTIIELYSEEHGLEEDKK